MAFVNPPSWTPVVSQSKFFEPPLPGTVPISSFVGEEDSGWLVSFQPPAASNVVPQTWLFDEQYPFLHGQFDEYFLQNPNPLVPTIAIQPLIFEDQFPIAAISVIVNEDYLLPVFLQAQQAVQPLYYIFDSGEIVPAAVQVTGVHYIPVFRRRRR